MRRALSLAALPALFALAGCQTMADSGPGAQIGVAHLRLANGQPAGTAELRRDGSEVTIRAALAGLPAGQHGFHLHTTGRCDPPDFQSAGGHLNPRQHEHGTQNPQGPHLGDLPNVTVGSDGTTSITATLHGDADMALPAIFDADGTAVMVHATADDYRTDPSGNAGARIACGVIERT